MIDKAMNKVILTLIGAALLTITGCSASSTASQPAQPTANTTQAAVKASGKIVAEGRVVPAKSAALGFTVGGVVSDVLVTEGAMVEANQVLIRLDSRAQTAAVAQADAALRRTQSRLAVLKSGARSQEVESAKAALEGAQAQLAKLQQGARPEDVAAASSAIDIAQAQYQQVQDGASQPQIEAARADMANAEAVLKLRQADYDRVAFQAGVAAKPESIALEQATNIYASAKARYDDLVKGATASSLGSAKARLQQAAAQYASIKAAPRPADIDVLKAEIHCAQAQLDLVQAGSRAEDIAAAQADVDAATAALDQARKSLDDTEMRASFGGVIAYLNVKAGEQVAPSAIVARLGDLNAWEIETTDLTELNVVNVHEGTTAAITVDALPGVEIPGKVVRMRQYGENKQGDIVYTVVIRPDTQNDKLRWNMTASVALDR